MNQKENIYNDFKLKKTLVSMVYIKIFQRFEGSTSRSAIHTIVIILISSHVRQKKESKISYMDVTVGLMLTPRGLFFKISVTTSSY